MSLNHIVTSNAANATDGLDISVKNLNVSENADVTGNLTVDGNIINPAMAGSYTSSIVANFGGVVDSVTKTLFIQSGGYYFVAVSAQVTAPLAGISVMILQMAPPPGRLFSQVSGQAPTLTVTSSNNNESNGLNAISGKTEFFSSTALRMYLLKTGGTTDAWTGESLSLAISGAFFTVAI